MLGRFEVKRHRRLVNRRCRRDFPESSAVLVADQNVVRLHVRIQRGDFRLTHIRFRRLDVERSGVAVYEHGFKLKLVACAHLVCHQSIASSVIFVVAMYSLSDSANSICANSVSCAFVALGFT